MRNILFFLSLFWAYHSWSQSLFGDYRIKYRNEPYNHIQPDTIFFGNQLWYDSSYHNQYFPYELGKRFTFPLGNETASNWAYEIDYFRMGFGSRTNNFYIYSRPVNAKTREYSETSPYQTRISADLDSTSAEGPVFKFELRQLGLADSLYHVKGYLNMQYWFFENGDIEVHYGDCLVPEEIQNVRKNGTGKFKLGFWMYQMDTFRTHYMYLTGNASSPRLSNGLNNPFVAIMYDSTLSPFPPSGTVYRFTKSFVGLESLLSDFDEIEVYPNPTKGLLNVEHLTNKSIRETQVLDLTGTKVELNGTINNGQLDLSELKKGLYFLHMRMDEGILTRKILVE